MILLQDESENQVKCALIRIQRSLNPILRVTVSWRRVKRSKCRDQDTGTPKISKAAGVAALLLVSGFASRLLEPQTKALDPKAWGGNHAGKPAARAPDR